MRIETALVYHKSEINAEMNELRMEKVNIEPTEDEVPSSVKEWHAWLSSEEARTFRVYKEDPNRFLADYRSEQQTVRDYEGREILELLQNANDAAAEKGIFSRVVISLSPEGLIVGNTGLPFSTGGIRSLRLAHLSPKAAQRKQYVGSKGLGFRSVLNWTTTPIILSGELHLAYSHSFLKQKQQQALMQIAGLSKVIEKEPKNPSKPIIPLLTFPYIPADGLLESCLDTDSQKAVLEHCQQLKAEGLDTVVGMPFDKPEFFERALEQIEELGHESLLFAPNLGELEIRVDSQEEDSQVWVKGLSENTAQIISQSSDDFWEYRIFREEGEIPKEHLSDESDGTRNYEVLIAVPMENGIKSGYLYSFFRTGVRFPFPLLAHATLELQANRELPQESSENRYVLFRLAALMAETAEKLVSSFSKWIGCQLLAKDSSELAPSLTKMRFDAALLIEAKNRKILPTLGGEILDVENCRWLDTQDTSWLPAHLLPSLIEAPPSDHVASLIEDLDVEELDQEEWVQTLRLLDFGSIGERAKFLAGLIANGLLDEDVPVGLLIDEAEKPIPEDCRIFLSPKEGQRHPLPDWIKVRFLNSELRDALMETLEISAFGHLVLRLNVFRVMEYSLQNVISALVAATNRRISDEEDRRDHYTSELLTILLKIFPENTDDRAMFPREAGIRLKSQSGEYCEARKLYLGKGYGRYGALMQSLYGYDLNKLIVDPLGLGIEAIEIDESKLADFLVWVGVAKLPRQFTEDKFQSKEFKQYLLAEIPYPAFLKYGGVADVKRDTPDGWNHPKLDKVRTIDELGLILERAESEAILTWLSVDPRIREWDEWANSHLDLLDNDSNYQNFRKYEGNLPCYIIWKIRNSVWIATSGGKRKPSDCFFGTKRFGKLLTEPAINPDHPLFELFDIWPNNAINAFDKAGVLTRISHLEREQVYRLLSALPEKDPEGKSARNLYTLLLQHEDSFFGAAEKASGEFKSSGKLWGRCGDEYGYYPVKELHYIDSEDIPDALADKIKIVDLPKRQGASKIERFFGVSQVNKSKIEYHIDNSRHVQSAEWLNGEFKSIKPVLYALRQAKTSQPLYLAAFKRLRIFVCDVIEGHLLYEGVRYPLTLGPWEWIHHYDTAYILQAPDYQKQKLPLTYTFLADAIGAVIATIFRLESGSDFARLILCPRQDRLKLLEKILGGEAVPDMAALEEEFEVASEGNDFKFDIPDEPEDEEGDDQDNAPSDTGDGGEEEDEPGQPSDENAGDEGNDDGDGDEGGPLGVDEKEHEPSATKRVKLRVQRKPSKGGKRQSGSRLVTDGEFCEKKVMEFELSEDPPRFPLHVGRVTGYNGPKCDILSFASRENRKSFKETKNPELIERFIEVKGRSSDLASILLKGNELDAARNYADRYYLYRLYVAGVSEYELSILQDPLNDPDAAIDLMEINFEVAQSTRRFDLAGGIKQGEHNAWDGDDLPEYENGDTEEE